MEIPPDGRQVMDPIYGRSFWSNTLSLIGDDGKNAGKAYIVTENVKKDVETVTKKGLNMLINIILTRV